MIVILTEVTGSGKTIDSKVLANQLGWKQPAYSFTVRKQL